MARTSKKNLSFGLFSAKMFQAKENIIMGKHTTLTREEYAEKFNEQMNRYNYIPQDGEVIIQCKESCPPYWFISNKGYLFTAYYNDIRIISTADLDIDFHFRFIYLN